MTQASNSQTFQYGGCRNLPHNASRLACRVGQSLLSLSYSPAPPYSIFTGRNNMSHLCDPMYDATRPGGYALDECQCPICHGILPGFVGIPGEWPCRCSDEDIDTFQEPSHG